MTVDYGYESADEDNNPPEIDYNDVFCGDIPVDNNQFVNGFARSFKINHINGNGGYIFLHVELIEQTDLQYKYHVDIGEDDHGYGGYCFGDVVINYTNQVIHNIIVNGQLDGRLRDQNEDCFDLSLQQYVRFITQLPYNF